MNLALDELADNQIIDELGFGAPGSKRIARLRACNVLFRRPFVEITLADGNTYQRHFDRASFAGDWAEASVILQTLTDIEIVSDFSFTPVRDRDALVERVLACRDECIGEANKMFDEGMYAHYLQQFGENCANLPAETLDRIAQARERLGNGAR